MDNDDWEVLSSNLKNKTVKTPFNITKGSHILYFSESSSKQTRFAWNLYVPVDNTPDIYTTAATYDVYGNMVSFTDADSSTVTFTYSPVYSYAYLTEVSAIVGTDIITTKATYDYDRGWMTSLQEPKGVEVGSGHDYLYTYDVLGRIIKKEFPLLPGQSERSYVEAVYDCEERAVTIIDQGGHYLTKEYDRIGRLTSVNVYTGEYGSGTLYATTVYTYTYAHQVKTVTDPQNHITTYTYDFLGRVTQTTAPDSTCAAVLYDDTDNRVISTNGRGFSRVSWFDWLSRVKKVEEEYAPDVFGVTTYEYDEVGHTISFTDAEGRKTDYLYTSFFGLTRIVYPDFTSEQYTYDETGNITSYTDANGNESGYTYDSLHRLTEILYGDGPVVSFVYDVNSNRIIMEDNILEEGDYTAYNCDGWNRLTTETRHISQDRYTVLYQYDETNKLTDLTYPDGMHVLYLYDDVNRLTKIKKCIDSAPDKTLLDNIQYNTESLLTQFDYGNYMQTTLSYDSRDRIRALDVNNGETPYVGLEYTWDNNNNITQVVHGFRDTTDLWHEDTETYVYDGLDRLTSAQCLSWSHTYTYDKTGNRTSKDGITYTINEVNEVTALNEVTSDITLVNEFRSRYVEHAGLAGYYTTFRDTRFRNPFPT